MMNGEPSVAGVQLVESGNSVPDSFAGRAVWVQTAKMRRVALHTPSVHVPVFPKECVRQ